MNPASQMCVFPITGKLNECREKMEDWGEFGAWSGTEGNH